MKWDDEIAALGIESSTGELLALFLVGGTTWNLDPQVLCVCLCECVSGVLTVKFMSSKVYEQEGDEKGWLLDQKLDYFLEILADISLAILR